ncbi:hypothetical protein F01_420517 [Burkholderia cenocepacia]|nr:hypothetical protein F01_420517 [Burkholderia cenocepacia]
MARDRRHEAGVDHRQPRRYAYDDHASGDHDARPHHAGSARRGGDHRGADPPGGRPRACGRHSQRFGARPGRLSDVAVFGPASMKTGRS